MPTHPFPFRDRILKTNPELEPLFDTLESARFLRIHPKTLRQMARRGEIRALRIGKPWRFRASSLQTGLYSQDHPN